MTEKEITSHTHKSLGFYKKNGLWYADIKGYDESKNLMVAGADKLCEEVSLALGGIDKYKIDLSSDIENPDEYIIRLRRILHDPWGATYTLSSKNKAIKLPLLAWICNMTHVFLGEHPKRIYIHSFNAK